MRRNLTRYKALNTRDKENTITRLLIAPRAKLRTADLVDDLSKLAAVNDLETARVQDNEPKVSVPDISTDARDISLYRYLVGVNNLMRTKNFLDLAKQGKSVPGQFVQGYIPAIKMVDDIVQAGPAYINLLRSLHLRAKMSPNRLFFLYLVNTNNNFLEKTKVDIRENRRIKCPVARVTQDGSGSMSQYNTADPIC